MRVTAKILSALALCSALAVAAPVPLDRARVHAEYQNGDFDKVIRDLEAYMKSGRHASRSDSVFIAKHLAVVYAANPDTRERGRYYMLRMLDLAPETDLLDMFVGEEVDGVFGKVSKEYAMMSKAAKIAKPVPAPAASVPAPAPRSAAVPRAAVPVRSAPPRRAESLPDWKMPAAPRNLQAIQSPSRDVPAEPAVPPSAASEADEPVPEWRGTAKWVGGGVALAVIGLTLYFAGSDDGHAKTYVVPKN
jgi:hypothetical protein